MAKLIIVTVIITIIGITIFQNLEQNEPVGGTNVNLVSQYSGKDKVNVKIEGQVVHPSTYSCSPQQTLKHLIDLAGGVLPDHDPSAYSEDVLIGNKVSFYIARKSQIPETCVAEVLEKVSINTAESTKLQEVGFDKNQASGIVTYRSEKGLFETIEDIMNVSGIGEKTFIKVRDRISL